MNEPIGFSWRYIPEKQAAGLKLCLDCISSVGTVPIDLSGVYLASCVSGKGLSSYPGLSMVFYNHEIQPAPKRLPRYLDLGFYAAQEGIPFTHSSNLLAALHTSLKRVNWEDRFGRLNDNLHPVKPLYPADNRRIGPRTVATSPSRPIIASIR